MKAAIIIAALATAFSFTPAVAATNLVKNGGFETGNFSGWDQTGDKSFTFVYKHGLDLPVDDGKYSAAFGPGSGYGSLTQTINTIPGGHYNVSFDLANTDITGSNVFIFSFDDGFQLQGGGLPPFDFGNFSIPVTASGLTADVSFLFYNPGGFFLLDDVSVTAAVPEPATWGLMVAGFATIGAAMRRRRLIAA